MAFSMLLIIRRFRVYKVDEFGVRNYHNAFLIALAFLLLFSVMALFSVALLNYESMHSDANIKTFSDAIWTMQMTASTVGFGDHYPVSDQGRVITTLMFYIGFGLVGFIVARLLRSVVGFSNTNVRNRELRKQNAEIIIRNQMLEQKVDSLVSTLENMTKYNH